MKICLDANVLVAAYLWKGGLCDKIIRRLVAETPHQLVLSQWVMEETQRTLYNDFGVSQEMVEAFAADLQAHPDTLVQPTSIALAPYPVADFDDRIVLTAALVADSDMLVTGDKALHAVAEVVHQMEGLAILNPGALGCERIVVVADRSNPPTAQHNLNFSVRFIVELDIMPQSAYRKNDDHVDD